VAGRTFGRIAGLAHRATTLERLVADTAAVLVAGHRRCILRGRAWLTGAVSETATRPAVSDPETEHVPRTGEPTVAHIVKTEPGENAAAKVLEARIYGTPLEALCGHVWVPSRDPKQLPLCEACKSIYEMYRMFNDGLPERPAD